MAVAVHPDRNPWLVHELNLIQRDRRFLGIAVVGLAAIWLELSLAARQPTLPGLTLLLELLPLTVLLFCFVHLQYRLSRPHVRYHGENAVFLCVLPRDGRELLYCQTVAVLFQPILLWMLLLPGILLLVGMGAVSYPQLLFKLVLMLLTLWTVAVHGVTRVPRVPAIFFGLPIATFLFVAGMGTLSGTIISVMSMISQALGWSNADDVVAFFMLFSISIVALPILVYYAIQNPVFTWLMQTSVYGTMIRNSEAMPVLAAPFTMLLNLASSFAPPGTLFAGSLGTLGRLLDFCWSVPLFSGFNWAFLLGIHLLFTRDAFARGQDQFEFFRVRGYPERLAELRWLERQRLQTRNVRTLSAQLYPRGQGIDQRVPARLRQPARWLLAWCWRFAAPRLAYRAITMEPEALFAWQEARRSRRAPASRPRRLPPAQQSRQAPPVAAVELQTSVPSPASQTSALPQQTPVPTVAAAAPVMTSQPAAIPAPAMAVAPVAPMPVPVLAIDGVEPKPARPLPWGFRHLAQGIGILVALTGRIVPETLRQNPFFARDWRALQRVLQGKQEGQWGYSWTILLVVNVTIASFALFIACTGATLYALMEVSVALRNVSLYNSHDSVNLRWTQEFAYTWLRWMFQSCPLVMLGLPIYSWLRERKRPDWEITLLNPQMGAGWLAGRWAFFVQLACFGMLLIVLVLLVLDPLLWLGFVPRYIYGSRVVEWQAQFLEPLSAMGYLVLAAAQMAWLYQLTQLGLLVVLCLPHPKGKAGTMTAIWVLTGCLLLVVVVLEALGGGRLLYLLADRLAYPLDVLRILIWEPLGTIWHFVSQGMMHLLPLLPSDLWNWYWGTSFNVMDVPARSLQDVVSWSLTFGMYVITALGLHRLSAALFESRIRSLEPRVFRLLRKRRRRVAAPDVVQSGA